MTPSAKAKELVDEFYKILDDKLGEYVSPSSIWLLAKESALMAVEEILDICMNDIRDISRLKYWAEVKKGI